MSDEQTDGDDQGVDIFGLGKIASAIPDSVYKVSASTLVKTFENLLAPITETTSGLGRYVHQKFANMVAAEKAIAVYTIGEAVHKAQERSRKAGITISAPASTKTFVKAIEEASREDDAVLHEMWANLLASQLIDQACPPFFVELLSSLGKPEALILLELLPLEELGPHIGGYFGIGDYAFTHWARQSAGPFHPWSVSCTLLIQLGLASMVGPFNSDTQNLVLLYRSKLGTAFLAAAAPPPEDGPQTGEIAG